MIEAPNTEGTEVKKFLDHLELNNRHLIPTYLTLQVLTGHLRKYTDEYPIKGLDPIDIQMLRAIQSFYPHLKSRDVNEFQRQVSAYLLENGYREKYLKYVPYDK